MARETSRISLNSSERMWYDIMDGDLYRELLLPGGFLNNPHHLSLLFNTDGVHAFKASRDEIWPLLVTINELHLSRSGIRQCMVQASSINVTKLGE